MKATLDDYFTENTNCQKFRGNHDFQHIFEQILSTDANIIAMIDVSEAGKPALSACVNQIEAYCDSQTAPTIDLKDDFTKQAIGRAIRTILLPFGYEVKKQKDIPRSYQAKYFTSASVYALTGPAVLCVQKRIVACGAEE